MDRIRMYIRPWELERYQYGFRVFGYSVPDRSFSYEILVDPNDIWRVDHRKLGTLYAVKK
jgi:hypothetical protein